MILFSIMYINSVLSCMPYFSKIESLYIFQKKKREDFHQKKMSLVFMNMLCFQHRVLIMTHMSILKKEFSNTCGVFKLHHLLGLHVALVLNEFVKPKGVPFVWSNDCRPSNGRFWCSISRNVLLNH